jgi:hypothetical protein
MDDDVALGGLGWELLQVFLGGPFQHFPVEIESASMCAACVFFSCGGKLSVGMRAPEQDCCVGVVLVFAYGKIVHKRSYAYDEHLPAAKRGKRNANSFLNDVRIERW